MKLRFVKGSSLALAAIAWWCAAAPGTETKPRLAPTPPMGWNSWEAFRKDFDEDAIKAQADAMVKLGLRDAGYRYIVLDGGWKISQRNAAGNLVPDPKKFPHGIKSLIGYVHSRGLKFGLHQPAGVKDCGHDQPGSQGNEDRDAALFASWGVDFIKYDQCDYIHDPKMTPGAPDLDNIALRQDGRTILSAEAEAPQNRLQGMARISECRPCSNGKSVTGIGYDGGALEFHARVPQAGHYDLDIHFAYPYYGQNRDHFKQITVFLSANGGDRRRLDIPYDIAKRYTTGVVSVGVDLKQGDNLLLLDDPTSQEEDVRLSYLQMGHALEHTGREILFSTSGAPRPWFWAQSVAHMWRTAGDIANRWTSIMNTLDRHIDVVQFAGPNFWADPDMLEIGAPSRPSRNGAMSPMTPVEQQTQFSLWAIMGAPLFISADLRNLDDRSKSLLLNHDVIALDQDPLAAPGRLIRTDGDAQILARRLKDGEAVALLNRGDHPTPIRVTAADLGLPQSKFKIRDLWTTQSRTITDGTLTEAVTEPRPKEAVAPWQRTLVCGKSAGLLITDN